MPAPRPTAGRTWSSLADYSRLASHLRKDDPYPLYESVRRHGRGLVRSRLGSWVTASHATASAILRDRRFSSNPVHQRGYQPPAYPPGDPRAGQPDSDLLTLDPPDHTRLRRLVSGAFTPKAVADLEPFIRDTAARLTAAADPAGFDLIESLAFPLPITVICHLLGVPAQDQARFRDWGRDVAATLDPPGPPQTSPGSPSRRSPPTCGTWSPSGAATPTTACCLPSSRSRRKATG